MNRGLRAWILGIAGLVAAGRAGSSEAIRAGARSAPDRAAFQIIVTRNIFDPARSVAATPVSRPPPAPSPPPAPAQEQIKLTGVLVSGGMALAFFQGTAEEHCGARRVGEAIAGLILTSVSTDRITTTRGDERLEIAVGTGLVRRGEGDWEAAAVGALPHVEPTAAAGPAPSTVSAAPQGGASEALKRMLARRKQELGQ